MTSICFTRFVSLSFFLFPFSFISISCSDNKQPTTKPVSWIDQAQNDPYNFSPQMDNPSVTGGGLTDFDKDAFNRDVNHVINP
jgi:hypothetical protein